MKILFKEDSNHKNDTEIVKEYVNKYNGDFDRAQEDLWKNNKNIAIVFAKSIYLLESGGGILGGEDFEVYKNDKFQFGIEGVGINDLSWIMEKIKKSVKEVTIENKDFNFILRSIYDKRKNVIYYASKNQARELFNQELMVKL